MADRIVVMRDGLVEQVGVPLELYDRPATLFVRRLHWLPGDEPPERASIHVNGAAVVRDGGPAWTCP